MFVLLVIVFLDFVGFGIIMPMIPVFTHNYHLNTINIGVLASSFYFANFFGAIILGYLSDIMGRKKLLILSIFGMMASFVATGIAQYLPHSFYYILLFRGLTGFFAGNLSIIFALVSNISTKQQLVKNMSYLGSAITLGIIFGPTIGGYLSNSYDSITPFYYTGAFYLVCFLMAIFTLKEPKISSDEFSEETKSIWNSLKKVVKSPTSLLFLSLFILFSFAFTGLEVFLLTATLGLKLKESPFMIGFIWTYFAIILTIVQLFITKYVPAKIALTFGLFMFAFGILGLIWVNNITLAFVIMTVIGFASGILFPNITANLSLSGSPKQQGIIFGINFAAEAIGGILGPYVLGFINYTFKSTTAVWITLFILLFAASLVTSTYYIKSLDKSAKK